MLRHWWPRLRARKLGPAASKRTVMQMLAAPEDIETGANAMNPSPSVPWFSVAPQVGIRTASLVSVP